MPATSSLAVLDNAMETVLQELHIVSPRPRTQRDGSATVPSSNSWNNTEESQGETDGWMVILMMIIPFIYILHFNLMLYACALDTFFLHSRTVFCCIWSKSNRHVQDYGMVCKGFEPGYCTTMVQQSGALTITLFHLPFYNNVRIQLIVFQIPVPT